ncbi:MAG: hypothetical protein WCJ40_16730 [Planctomycetota bacterium]
MFMKSVVMVLSLVMLSGCGGSSDQGKPVDEAESKKAADAASQDVKDSEAASKKLVVKKKSR